MNFTYLKCELERSFKDEPETVFEVELERSFKYELRAVFSPLKYRI